MSAAERAADDLAKLAKFFSGLIELEPELRRVGSLENLAAETQARAEKLRGEAAQAEHDLAQVGEMFAQRKSQLQELDDALAERKQEARAADQKTRKTETAIEAKETAL